MKNSSVATMCHIAAVTIVNLIQLNSEIHHTYSTLLLLLAVYMLCNTKVDLYSVGSSIYFVFTDATVLLVIILEDCHFSLFLCTLQSKVYVDLYSAYIC